MPYYINRLRPRPQTPPTSPDPIEELFYSLHESERKDLLDGVTLDVFRTLYEPMARVAYREAALKLVPVVAFALDFMRNSGNEVQYWQAAFAIGAPDCIGATMTTKAVALGLKSRACLSQGAVKFCQGAGLPPSGYMKGAGTGKAYSDAREEFLAEQQDKIK